MNQRQLEVFLAAARHGNITAAANELFLTQPTASYQLRLLEEEFGSPLFERRARGVVHWCGNIRNASLGLSSCYYSKQRITKRGFVDGHQ